MLFSKAVRSIEWLLFIIQETFIAWKKGVNTRHRNEPVQVFIATATHCTFTFIISQKQDYGFI